MVEQERKSPGFFHSPCNLGAFPDLWLQAKLTIFLKQVLDKWAWVLVAVAAAVWLRRDVAQIEPTVRAVRARYLNQPTNQKPTATETAAAATTATTATTITTTTTTSIV